MTVSQYQLTGVSVIMPTFNEADNITDLVQLTAQTLYEVGVTSVEIIVTDDDSPDRTWEIAQGIQCPTARVQVIRRLDNHGLTPSIQAGIAAATHDVIVWLDCDFSHPPEYIPQLLYMIQHGFDVVVNSRYTIGGYEEREGKGGPLQLLLSLLLNWGVRFLLDPAFSDYTSGFVAVRRTVLKTLPLRGDYGEYFVDFIFRAIRARYRICELPFIAPPRRSGESKTGNRLSQYLWRGRKYLWTVFQLRWQVLCGKL